MTTTSKPMRKTAHAPEAHPEPLSAAVQAALEPLDSPRDAEALTRELAGLHYENFSVVSLLLPRRLRQDFCNVYAFCRIADDLSDTPADRETALARLSTFADQTRACFAGEPRAAVFTALRKSIERHDLSLQPFIDLIDAFQQDQRTTRYETFDQLRDYCRRSADPVGRIVLQLCGYHDAARFALSDFTCTGLQLANFWQDVRRDLLELDRIYLPRETMDQFSVSEAQLREGRADENYRAMIHHEVDRAELFFDRGEALLPMLNRSVRPQIALFGRGGRAILDAIRRQNYDTLTRRPSLSKWQKSQLILTTSAASVARLVPRGGLKKSAPKLAQRSA